MKKINRIIKEKTGSALLYVMIVIIILVMVVAVALVATANANRQSAFEKDYEQVYYSVESATQVAAELVAVEVGKVLKVDTALFKAFDSEPSETDVSGFKAQIAGTFDPVEGIVKSGWDDRDFDGLLITRDMITVEFFPEVNKKKDPDSDVWVVYISRIEYTVRVDSERSVKLTYAVDGVARIESQTITTGGILGGGAEGAAVSLNGVVHIGASAHLATIAEIIANAKTSASNALNVMPPTSERKTLGSNNLTATSNAVISAASPYAYASSALTLSGNIKNTDIQYLYVNGNLTINAGTYEFPNLKNIFVTGSVTINNGVNFYGIGARTPPEEEGDPPGGIIGTNFYIGGSLSISGITAVTIRDCRFYSSGAISVSFNNNGALNGNSIYISYNNGVTLTTSGQNRFSIGNDTFAPQFYANGELNISSNNNASRLFGIYASSTNIKTNGNPATFLVGAIIAPSASGGIMTTSASKIGESSLENLMDVKYGAKKTSVTTEVHYTIGGGGVVSIVEA